MSGWVKVHRELLDKPIWKNSTPEQKSILITLVVMADHKPNEWEWKGKPFKTVPGQMVSSHNSIAKKAGKGVSRQNVRTALKRFEKYDFLTYLSTHSGLLISIINWHSYQSKENTTNIPNQQTTNTPLTLNKNVRTKEKKTNSVEFNLFWEIYAKKNDRKKCETKWNKISNDDKLKIITVLPEYIESTPDIKFRKNPITYLNNESWNNEAPKKNNGSDDFWKAF